MKGSVKVSEWGGDLDAKIERIIADNPPRNQAWSDQEIYVLRKMWGQTAARNIAKIIPARSIGAIRKKAQELGL